LTDKEFPANNADKRQIAQMKEKHADFADFADEGRGTVYKNTKPKKGGSY